MSDSDNREELRRLKDELAAMVSHLSVLSGGELGILREIQEAKAKLEDLRRAVLNMRPQAVMVDELAPMHGDSVTFARGEEVATGIPLHVEYRNGEQYLVGIVHKPQDNTRLGKLED